MEQYKRVLVFENKVVILPHIIQYLSVLGIKVDPKPDEKSDISQNVERVVADFIVDNHSLEPMESSQGRYWLRAPAGVEERMFDVGNDMVTFLSSKHERIYLGMFEGLPNGGFKLKTIKGNLEGSTETSISIWPNRVNAIAIEAKGHRSWEGSYIIPSGEDVGTAWQIMDSIAEEYKSSIPDDEELTLEDKLFLAMFKDNRLCEGLAAYIRQLPKDLMEALHQSRGVIFRNCGDAVKQARKVRAHEMRLLAGDYDETKAALHEQNERPYGLVKTLPFVKK